MLQSDPTKPVDWYMVCGFFFVMVSGALTLTGDRNCFVYEPQTDFARLVAIPTLLFYHLTHERSMAGLLSFIFWGVIFGGSTFALLALLIQKVLLPFQMKRMVQVERQQEFYKNKFRAEVPEIEK